MKTLGTILLTTVVFVALGCAGSTATKSTSADTYPARIAADDRVEPPTDHRGRIIGDVQGDLSAQFELCITPEGDVTDVELVRSSGIASYDVALQQHVQDFKYEPYPAAAADSQLCKRVSLVYRSL